MNVKMINDVSEESILIQKNKFKWQYHKGQKVTPLF